MKIVLPGGPGAPSDVAEAPAVKSGERNAVPWYERLVLAGLLLVVVVWIALRLLRILLAAS